jgi:hypothetical protein
MDAMTSIITARMCLKQLNIDCAVTFSFPASPAPAKAEAGKPARDAETARRTEKALESLNTLGSMLEAAEFKGASEMVFLLNKAVSELETWRDKNAD